jgi:hypothetical protein
VASYSSIDGCGTPKQQEVTCPFTKARYPQTRPWRQCQAGLCYRFGLGSASACSCSHPRLCLVGCVQPRLAKYRYLIVGRWAVWGGGHRPPVWYLLQNCRWPNNCRIPSTWLNVVDFVEACGCGTQRYRRLHLVNLTFIGPCIVIYFCSKPTRCISLSNSFGFELTFYMFRTVFPSIIRSSRLYIQQQVYVKQILPPAC